MVAYAQCASRGEVELIKADATDVAIARHAVRGTRRSPARHVSTLGRSACIPKRRSASSSPRAIYDSCNLRIERDEAGLPFTPIARECG